jgi:hypothetical protein
MWERAEQKKKKAQRKSDEWKEEAEGDGYQLEKHQVAGNTRPATKDIFTTVRIGPPPCLLIPVIIKIFISIAVLNLFLLTGSFFFKKKKILVWLSHVTFKLRQRFWPK